MPFLKIRAERTIIVSRYKHQYVCDCCQDEFENMIDKSFIRKFHLCSYCYESKIKRIKCDCNNKTHF